MKYRRSRARATRLAPMKTKSPVPNHVNNSQTATSESIHDRIGSLQKAFGNQAVNQLMQNNLGQPTSVARQHEASIQRHPGKSEIAPVEMPGGKTKGATKGTGTTAPAPKEDTSAERWSKIKKVLGKTSIGKWALKIVDKHKVKVEALGTEPGSYFAGSENKIYLNKAETVSSSSIILVHEAQHAETFNVTGDVDATKVSRDVYVKTLITDEAKAVVRQILVIGQMTKAKIETANTSVGADQVKAYWDAYNKGVEEAVKANKKASSSAKNKAGEEAGFKKVYDMFFDGTFVTSTTGESYGDYYGGHWDSVNKPPEEAAGEAAASED